jgi:hypothetical protein
METTNTQVVRNGFPRFSRFTYRIQRNVLPYILSGACGHLTEAHDCMDLGVSFLRPTLYITIRHARFVTPAT